MTSIEQINKEHEEVRAALKKANELNEEVKKCVANIHEIVKEFVYNSNKVKTGE